MVVCNKVVCPVMETALEDLHSVTLGRGIVRSQYTGKQIQVLIQSSPFPRGWLERPTSGWIKSSLGSISFILKRTGIRCDPGHIKFYDMPGDGLSDLTVIKTSQHIMNQGKDINEWFKEIEDSLMNVAACQPEQWSCLLSEVRRVVLRCQPAKILWGRRYIR
jgi:hypothetical protein